MEQQSNTARQIRAMVETLHELAGEYDGSGQLNCRDQVNDVADALGALTGLPDPDDEGEDVPSEDDDYDEEAAAERRHFDQLERADEIRGFHDGPDA